MLRGRASASQNSINMGSDIGHMSMYYTEDDPRDTREVLIQQGIEPHPGPPMDRAQYRLQAQRDIQRQEDTATDRLRYIPGMYTPPPISTTELNPSAPAYVPTAHYGYAPP